MKAKWVNYTKIIKNIQKEGFEKLVSQKDEIERGETHISQKAYYKFGRPPIDTRESIGSTTAKMIILFNQIILRYKIDTPQSIFFTLGLGSNRKYGQRNPIRKAGSKLANRIDKKGNYTTL
jgi:hypothetical protein